MTDVPEESDRITGDTLTMVRVFDAAPERVFDAWTNEEQLGEWWGPEWVSTPRDTVRVVPEVGGEWSLTMVGPDGAEHRSENIITAFDRPNRIELITAPAGGVRATLRVTFQAVGGKTVMTVVNRVLTVGQDFDAMATGWRSMLSRLAALSTGAGRML